MARLPKNPRSAAGAAVASGNVGRQLGAVARRVRESQDLTLTDVANSAGISAGMLSRLETGHVTPSLETLIALAGALGVRPALLLQQLGGERRARSPTAAPTQPKANSHPRAEFAVLVGRMRPPFKELRRRCFSESQSWRS